MDRNPMDFVRAFRRRYFFASALRLTFLAAILNEAFRWTAIVVNSWTSWKVPVLNTGPLFLVAALLISARRLSLPNSARLADGVMSFRDRLLSYVDFSSRRDIPPALAAAQAGEVASSLRGVSVTRLVPVRPLLFTGPFLLFLSVFYPNLYPSAYVPPVIDSGRFFTENHYSEVPDRLPDGSGESLSSDKPGPDIEVASDTADSHDRTSPAGEEESGAPGALSAVSLDESGGERQKPRVHDKDIATPPGGLASKTVGEQLSQVVDPVYTAQGKRAEAEDLPSETMYFRFIPKAAAGEGASNTSLPLEELKNGILVDLQEVPEPYRVIVRQYFRLLAGEGDSDSSGGTTEERS